MTLPGLMGTIALPNNFSTEYAAVLSRAIALGYALPSAAQQVKQNTLLAALKTAGIWTKLDALYVFANDGGSAFATLNWKNPSANQATLVSSPVFTTNEGFAGDGVGAYIDTNFACATHGVNYTLDNAGRFAWMRAYNATGGSIIDGMAGATNRMVATSSTGQRVNQSTGSSAPTSGSGVTGLKSLYRTSSTNLELFTNTSQTSITASSVSIAAGNQFVLRSSANYGASQLSVYGIGASLVAENTALYNAINTYMGSL